MKIVRLSFSSAKSAFLASLGLLEEKAVLLSQLEVPSKNRYVEFFFSQITIFRVVVPCSRRRKNRYVKFFFSGKTAFFIVPGPSRSRKTCVCKSTRGLV